MKALLSKIFNNKVVLYMGSRYLTYALQFFTTLIVAIKLGPQEFGIWSFVLLIINFFNIVDFGISNSLNVLLVQERSNTSQCARYISASSIIITILSALVVLTYVLVRYINPEIINKYNAWQFLPVVVFVVILAYFNKSFSAVYRVGNRLLEVAIYQSLVPVLLFASIVIIHESPLWYMTGSYLVGHVIILIVFLRNGLATFKQLPSAQDIKAVSSKGIWLFLYNSAFYLIMYLTLLFVSNYYQVEEYGKFNFAYTLSNSIFLLVDAFGFIVFPKMLDKLKSKDYNQCRSAINMVRSNYMTLVYSLVFFALPFFELFCSFIPKYSDCGRALCLSAVALLPYANAFGMNTFLIAQNKERVLSFVSITLLFINAILLLVFKTFMTFPFDLYFLSPMILYVIYTISCALITRRKMGDDINVIETLKLSFPMNTMVFILISLICIILSYSLKLFWVLLIPALLYCLINYRNMIDIKKTITAIIHKPNIVDL